MSIKIEGYTFTLSDTDAILCDGDLLVRVVEPTHRYAWSLSIENGKSKENDLYTDYDYDTESYYAKHTFGPEIKVPDSAVNEALNRFAGGER